jgi:hypothetical protein
VQRTTSSSPKFFLSTSESNLKGMHLNIQKNCTKIIMRLTRDQCSLQILNCSMLQ